MHAERTGLSILNYSYIKNIIEYVYIRRIHAVNAVNNSSSNGRTERGSKTIGLLFVMY